MISLIDLYVKPPKVAMKLRAAVSRDRLHGNAPCLTLPEPIHKIAMISAEGKVDRIVRPTRATSIAGDSEGPFRGL